MKHITNDKNFKTKEMNNDETKEVKDKLLRMEQENARKW
jgi:hypothetical protein